MVIHGCAAEHQTLKRGLIEVLSSRVPPIIERIPGYRSRVIETADPQIGQKWRHNRFFPIESGLICGELSHDRHRISRKNDPDQKGGPRLALTAITLANSDSQRFAFVPILHRTAETMTA